MALNTSKTAYTTIAAPGGLDSVTRAAPAPLIVRRAQRAQRRLNRGM